MESQAFPKLFPWLGRCWTLWLLSSDDDMFIIGKELDREGRELLCCNLKLDKYKILISEFNLFLVIPLLPKRTSNHSKYYWIDHSLLDNILYQSNNCNNRYLPIRLELEADNWISLMNHNRRGPYKWCYKFLFNNPVVTVALKINFANRNCNCQVEWAGHLLFPTVVEGCSIINHHANCYVGYKSNN